MPHLSPLYRFLTVLYAVFGFGRIFLRFWTIFFFGFAVSNIPQCPPRTGLISKDTMISALFLGTTCYLLEIKFCVKNYLSERSQTPVKSFKF